MPQEPGRHEPGTSVVEIQPTAWMLPDRQGFSAWVERTFQYGPEDTDLFRQQRFVRDFMQTGSPYQGLVLYHAMGVGKSRAAVTMLMELRRSHVMIVMLPASLKNNFVGELRRFGCRTYAEGFRWERNPEALGAWQEVTEDSARRGAGTPFRALLPAQQREICAVLDDMLRLQIRFISYNGLSERSVARLCDGPTNPFEGAVVVIDEAHNFVSSATKGKLVLRVYERIMAARERKVILLTGTPFVNNAMELPSMLNLAHGFVRTLVFHVRPAGGGMAGGEVERRLRAALNAHPRVNRYEIDYTGGGGNGAVAVRVEPTPPGFVRRAEGTLGTDDGMATRLRGVGWYERVLDEVQTVLVDAVGDVVQGGRLEERLLLPVGEEFERAFVAQSGYGLKRTDVLTRRALGLVSYYGKYDESIYPSRSPRRAVECVMSAHQFDVYKGLRDEERRKERAAARFSRSEKNRTGLDAASDASQGYRTSSRQACTFVFPSAVPRPYKKDIRRRRSAASGTKAKGEGEEGSEGSEGDGTVDREYDRALERAIDRLRTRPHVAALRSDEALDKHSPKFHAMLSSFRGKRYPMLVYSQFRTAEGIGLLAACLDANGYARVSMTRDAGSGRGGGGGRLRMVRSGGRGRGRGRGGTGTGTAAPAYMVFDNDDPEAAKLLLSAFNSEFNSLPPELQDDVRALLREAGAPQADENLHGNFAQLLLITKSGAEGISLQNVREVHVMEPFWHANRIDQVMGRAVRANSHYRLPPDERRVDVFIYTAVFSAEQAAQRTIQVMDGGQTSDQHIQGLAAKKGVLVGDMLRVFKVAAVDCRLFRADHREMDAQHTCAPRTAHADASAFGYALSYGDDIRREEDASTRLSAVRVRGRLYYLDPDSGRLYDYDQLKQREVLVHVGDLEPGRK